MANPVIGRRIFVDNDTPIIASTGEKLATGIETTTVDIGLRILQVISWQFKMQNTLALCPRDEGILDFAGLL